MGKATTDGATKRTRVRKPAGESIEVKLVGGGAIILTVQGGPLTMDDDDLALIQEIRGLIRSYHDGDLTQETRPSRAKKSPPFVVAAAEQDLAQNNDLVQP
jgi:hypothetical protein